MIGDIIEIMIKCVLITNIYGSHVFIYTYVPIVSKSL